ncbi:transglutaminase family protein [Rheinheimera sp.]|uniref:transglutaminase family protein n=1 Tax=Rheinheimera sp. TaxID=1869214 RepID=UPI003D2E628C
MRYQLSHLTRYGYQRSIANSYNLTCLRPLDLPWQQLLNYRLTVEPGPCTEYSHLDYFGNSRQLLHVLAPHQQLEVRVEAELSVSPRLLASQLADGASLLQACDSRAVSDVKVALCRQASRNIPHLPATGMLWQQIYRPDLSMLQNVARLNQLIYEEFQYDPEFSTVVTPIADVLAHQRGVCQDFAQLAISCLRSQGLAARYVSGYLETRPPPGQPRLQGADASHAWFAVYDPVLGWVDFDPTNNVLADVQHLTLAFGRDYADVVPLKGVLQGSGEHLLEVAVDVLALD